MRISDWSSDVCSSDLLGTKTRLILGTHVAHFAAQLDQLLIAQRAVVGGVLRGGIAGKRNGTEKCGGDQGLFDGHGRFPFRGGRAPCRHRWQRWTTAVSCRCTPAFKM